MKTGILHEISLPLILLLGVGDGHAQHAPPVPSSIPAKAAGWYTDSWIHSHVSLSLPPGDLSYFARQVEAAGLDAIQFHTNKLDLWDAVRNAGLDHQLNFKMVATINAAGSWHARYDNDPAYVFRIHPDGSSAGRWDRKHLCFNAPAVRQRVIREKYEGLPARLHPDQVWIDECVITVNLCWCEHCKQLYREQYRSEPPTELTAENHDAWRQWVSFHRESFERWTRDVKQAVNSVLPGTLVTFNHAWFVEQPESPPAHVRNLSADIHHDPLELGLYARYGGSAPVPFDLMPGLGEDIWAGVRPKSPDRILNDVALIIAHGGRWNIGEFPTDFTTLRAEPKYRGEGRRPADAYLDVARKGARFARLRQAFCQHTKPVPHVALLHAASTHYDHVIRNTNRTGNPAGLGTTSDGTRIRNEPGRINSRVYWPGNNPVHDSVTGAYLALLENHIHFNFILEDRLGDDLSNAALLVLPEQHRLAPASLAAIKDYVRNGGRLFATGSTRQAGLDEVLDFDSSSVQQFGKGKSLYLGRDLFRIYHARSGYSRAPSGDAEALRMETARLFESLLPNDRYRLHAPPWIEWTLRRSAGGKELLVHLINRGIDWKLPAGKPTEPFRLWLPTGATPSAITLEPGGEPLNATFDDGSLSITLAPAAVPHHRILRIIELPSLRPTPTSH